MALARNPWNSGCCARLARRAWPALLVLLPALGGAGCGKGGAGTPQLVYAFYRSFSARGAEPDSLRAPAAVVALGDGVLIREVWVAEAGANRISRFDFGGTYLRSFGASGQFDGPIAMARANDSTVVVLDQGGSRVSVVDTSGATRAVFPWPYPDASPAGPRAASGGSCIAATRAEVYRQDPAYGQFRLSVFDMSGARVRRIGEAGSLASCSGLAVRDSSVWVADLAQSRIHLCRTDGRYVRSFGVTGGQAGGSCAPGPIALTDDANLLVTCPDQEEVHEYRADGTFVTRFGKAQLGDPATFAPWGIATYSSSLIGEYIYVADPYVGRVYVVIRRYVRPTGKPGLTGPR
jgi:DNA-binding beta-propeller fold protein YncE